MPLSTKKATAQTVASNNIIPYVIFRFHERRLICRFHELSHTFATNALAHGMDIKTLSTILGHVSSVTTLNTYSHVTDEMRQRAAVKIDQGIAKAEVQEDAAAAQPERTMTTFQARKRWSREAS